MKRHAFVMICFVYFSSFSISNAAEVFRLPPENPNPSEKYIFYLHGIAVELRGPDKFSKRFGKKYGYTKIVKGFNKRGFNVISQVRKKGTKPLFYSFGIMSQINQLLRAGVPGKKYCCGWPFERRFYGLNNSYQNI